MSNKGMQRLARPLAMAAAAAVLAACGGGGGGAAPVEPGAPQASLRISGTVAVGMAVPGAEVKVQCENGSGTAKTDLSGKYSTNIVGGTLPCMIQATGKVADDPVVMHSVATVGSFAASSGYTDAVANVTPVTELVLAHTLGASPAVFFTSFLAQVTGMMEKLKESLERLAESRFRMIEQIRARVFAGYPQGDPFTSELVAATPENPGGGNEQDKALDALGDLVPPKALPVVVNQVANAAASGSTAALEEVMQGVAGGTLDNCPAAISGKYRTIDVTGEMKVHTVDFKAKTWLTEGGSSPETIVPGSTQACEFTVGWTTVVMGPNGVGAFHRTDGSGLVFPVQSHTLAEITGGWNFLQSGINESNVGEHFFGKFTVAADGKATVCDYNVMAGNGNFGGCEPDPATGALTAAADGGFDLAHGDTPARLFGYRAPDDTLFLFGTTNAAGSWSPPAFRTHIVLVRPKALVTPAVGTVTKFWDISSTFNGNFMQSESLTMDSNTVTAVDAAAGSFTRTRASDNRVDTFLVNQPVEGLRYRALNGSVQSIFQLQIPSLGIALAFDNTPEPVHMYSISVVRP